MRAAAAATGRLGRLSAHICPASNVVTDELAVLDAAQELLPVTVTPDLLMTQAGAAVKDAGAWRQRRQELNDIIVPHEFGGMPPEPARVDTTVMTDANIRQWQDWLPGVKHRILEAYVVLPAGGTLSSCGSRLAQAPSPSCWTAMDAGDTSTMTWYEVSSSAATSPQASTARKQLQTIRMRIATLGSTAIIQMLSSWSPLRGHGVATGL